MNNLLVIGASNAVKEKGMTIPGDICPGRLGRFPSSVADEATRKAGSGGASP